MPTRDRTALFMTRSAPYEKSKCLGSRGSMVARLKLKEIDGRAPPGVNRSCSAPKSTRETGKCVSSAPESAGIVLVARAPGPGGDTLKLRGVPKASGTKQRAERPLWRGLTASVRSQPAGCTMGNSHPSPYGLGYGEGSET